MPLRTNIASSIQTPAYRSPFSTLKSLQEMNEQRSLTEGRQLINEQHRRDLATDDLVSHVMGQYTRPDEGLDAVYQTGDPGAIEVANKIAKGLSDQRKARADAEAQKIDTTTKGLSAAAHMFEAVKAKGGSQGEYDTAYQAVSKMIAPELLAMVPKEYDPIKVDKMMAWTTSQSELARSAQQAIDNANKANELQNANAKSWEERVANREKARTYWTQAASTALGTSEGQQDWDNKQRLLLEHGADPQDLAPFGRVWSNEAVVRARQLGMTPNEQSNAQHQTVTEMQAEEGLAIRRKREKRLADAPKTLKGLTPNAVDVIERNKDTALRAFEKEQKTPEEGVGNPNAGKRPIDDTSPAANAARAAAKLTIENRARSRKGEPTLEDQEVIYSAPGYEGKLKKLRDIYHNITNGQEMPLERMDKLPALITAEKDPAKRAALVKELRDLRAKQD